MDAPNPWQPITDKVDLAVLGKLAEELGEAQAAVARCIIQGIEEKHPITEQVNREWLENELADIEAGRMLAVRIFGLDYLRMAVRTREKIDHLERWHELIKQQIEANKADEAYTRQREMDMGDYDESSD